MCIKQTLVWLPFTRHSNAGAKGIIIADLRLTTSAEKLIKENKTVVFKKCYVTVWKDLQEAIEAGVSSFGDVPDIYVASAGVFEPASRP